MRRFLLAGAVMFGAIGGIGAPAQAQYGRPPGSYPAPSWNHGGGYGGGWNHGGKPHGGGYGGGYHGGGYGGGYGGYHGGSQYVGHGGYVYNRPGDGRPPVYNRPGDGLPPLPAQRLPNGQYLVNQPGDGLPPFVVGRPRY
ncbi:hypothetical protein TA3x_003630 [Tundrisphaera sp. TA3]|uniref:hypothetical protein n=1 Tax=Tundrisphaera sp. TA3 TaxID=3435775 RepID=UPI003EB97997